MFETALALSDETLIVQPMTRTDALLKEIDAFLAEHPLSDNRFGMLAARDGRLMERLRKGGRVWPEKEEEIRRFMVSRSLSMPHFGG